MRLLFSSVKKDLLRWKQDWAAILLWLGIPLVIGVLITSLMDGQGGGKPKGILLIADQDDTVLSGLVSSAFSGGELGEIILVEKTTAEAGKARIDAGEVSGFLTIPKGFTTAFLESRPVTLELKTNPSQIILPGIITDVTEILLDAGFYVNQLFGDEIDQIVNHDFTQSDDELVTRISLAVQARIETAAPLLFPPAFDLSITDPPTDAPELPYALLYLPGIILMAVMFSANALAGDFWTERKSGTLRRLACTPAGLWEFIAGKAVAAGMLVGSIGLFTLIIGFLYHDIDWIRLIPSLAWLTLSGVAFFAWFGALQMLAGNQKAGNLLTSILLFPLLMAGGSFFPLAALPDWIANIGRSTPNGFIVDRLTDELTAASAWSINAQSWAVALLMAASGLAICAWRLRTGFARG